MQKNESQPCWQTMSRVPRAAVASDRQRRSRFSRVSAGRQAPTNLSAVRPIHRFPETRKQSQCLHQIVGIALEKYKRGLEINKQDVHHI